MPLTTGWRDACNPTRRMPTSPAVSSDAQHRSPALPVNEARHG